MSEAYPERPQPWSEYMLCGRVEPQKLVTEVNNLIIQGWQPQGGIILAVDSYIQAMVR